MFSWNLAWPNFALVAALGQMATVFALWILLVRQRRQHRLTQSRLDRLIAMAGRTTEAPPQGEADITVHDILKRYEQRR